MSVANQLFVLRKMHIAVSCEQKWIFLWLVIMFLTKRSSRNGRKKTIGRKNSHWINNIIVTLETKICCYGFYQRPFCIHEGKEEMVADTDYSPVDIPGSANRYRRRVSSGAVYLYTFLIGFKSCKIRIATRRYL